jgi:hypothetical protein
MVAETELNRRRQPFQGCGLPRIVLTREEYFGKTVPKIVPSGRLDGLSSKVAGSAERRIFTSESERMQTPLKCCYFRETNLRDQGVGGSNPLSPTNLFSRSSKSFTLPLTWATEPPPSSQTSDFQNSIVDYRQGHVSGIGL